MEDRELREAMILMKTTMRRLGEVADALADKAEGLRAMLGAQNERLNDLVKALTALTSGPKRPFH